MRLLLVLGLAGCTSGPWLSDDRMLVDSSQITNEDCRTDLCVHSENTDLTVWGGAIYLVHRTAESQILGPNSSLRVYRSDDDGAHFTLLAIIPAPSDRDLRDPCFYTIGGNLAIKALTRLPVNSVRDSDVDTITVNTVSSDGGMTWSPLANIGPEMWSFWRIKDDASGVHYSAAYEDGDLAVQLFSSQDGTTWTPGATIYDVSDDTPLETELVFMPSGTLLALVRMDGTDDELLGNVGRLRTKVCWAEPPYASFSCPQELTGVRLDGPVAFFDHAGKRLFVIARKHFIETEDRKRTALYELRGDFDNAGELAIVDHGNFPSAGDTSYAGVAPIDDHRFLVSWYSSPLSEDGPWARAIFGPTDIWQGVVDLSKL
ncbi:MAG TPA: sialidase family protein [Kofleriaceae bacterium]|nr:sialidase family protein [Kofleriaceae bacterium]